MVKGNIMSLLISPEAVLQDYRPLREDRYVQFNNNANVKPMKQRGNFPCVLLFYSNR
jgi:hypothetical protein